MSSWLIRAGLRHRSDLALNKHNLHQSQVSITTNNTQSLTLETSFNATEIKESTKENLTLKTSVNATEIKESTKENLTLKTSVNVKEIKESAKENLTLKIIADTTEIKDSKPKNLNQKIPEKMLDYYIGAKLNNFDYCLNNYELTQFPKKGKHVAVLLESRFIPNITVLLKQISRFLSNEWSIILLVANDVLDKYKCIVEKINNTIQVELLTYALSSVKDYNDIMLNPIFWKKFESFKKILIFQGDTMIYKYGIEKFMKYDYVGAPWPTSLDTITRIGNGGFSLRSVLPVINCIENYDKININKYLQYDQNHNKLGKQPEDIVFSYGMKQFGYKLPDVNIAKHFAVETVEFNTDILGSHQLNVWNKKLGDQVLKNSIIPYTLGIYPTISGHRFGWKYVNDSLNEVFNNADGIYINTWFDCQYLFDNKSNVPADKNWIGISHLTPVYYKKFFHLCNINKLVTHKLFISDLERCKGIFTLSKQMKHYLKHMLCIMGYPNIPVDNLYHPIDIVQPLFNPLTIDSINTVVSIGCQLRKMSTTYKLNTLHKKIWLPGRKDEEALNFLKLECDEMDISINENEMKSVKIMNLNNLEYDNLLVNSFIVVDLYDASANNALIECISRDIPCFISNLPAVCEYIGPTYPLLFNSIEELEEKMANKDLIYSAYKYLIDRPKLKERLTIDYFIKSILNSNVTKNVLSITL